MKLLDYNILNIFLWSVISALFLTLLDFKKRLFFSNLPEIKTFEKKCKSIVVNSLVNYKMATFYGKLLDYTLISLYFTMSYSDNIKTYNSFLFKYLQSSDKDGL